MESGTGNDTGGGESSEVISVAARFFDRLREGRWSDAAAMCDPQAAAVVRETQLASIVEMSKHRDARIKAHETNETFAHTYTVSLDEDMIDQFAAVSLNRLPGAPNLRQIAALTPSDFLAFLLETANGGPVQEQAPQTAPLQRRIVGAVRDGDDLAHVLYRMEAPGMEFTDPEHVEILRLRRIDGRWHVVVSPFSFDLHISLSFFLDDL